MTADRHAVVIRAASVAPFDRGRGLRTLHMTRSEIGAEELLTGITEFDPGAEVPPHLHNCEEAVVILEGLARFEADGVSHDLEVGDSTYAPAGVVHRFVNRGAGRMRIFWAYGSVDATRTVVTSGKTFRIGREDPA